jgi:hypothetical protein
LPNQALPLIIRQPSVELDFINDPSTEFPDYLNPIYLDSAATIEVRSPLSQSPPISLK